MEDMDRESCFAAAVSGMERLPDYEKIQRRIVLESSIVLVHGLINSQESPTLVKGIFYAE
jgi:hypothetical protein